MATRPYRSPVEFVRLVFDHPGVNPERVLIAKGAVPTNECVFCTDTGSNCDWTIAWIDQNGKKYMRAFHERHLGEEMS
jgi:hypothetical protein